MEIDSTCGGFRVKKKNETKPFATIPTHLDYNTPAIQTRTAPMEVERKFQENV
jgi:hypothetical protein